MLSLLFTLTLSMPSSASSLWSKLVEESHKNYAADFASDRGTAPTQDAVGFSLQRSASGGVSEVYFVDGTQVGSFTYGCEPSDGNLKCVRAKSGDFRAYTRSSKVYSIAEMVKAVDLALELFQRRVAPESTISSLRFWEAAREMHFEVVYEKNGSQRSFLSCHFHGNEGLDCHRERTKGPNAPQKE